MFNIGMGELIFIVLLALIVVGPERLPKIMREFGRIVRQIRLVVNEFTSQFGDELQTIQELQQPIQELQQLASDINPVKQVTKLAVDLDATVEDGGVQSSSAPKTRDEGSISSPSSLVKPTAAFHSSPAKTTSNPMKIIAQSRKVGDDSDGSVSSDVS